MLLVIGIPFFLLSCSYQLRNQRFQRKPLDFAFLYHQKKKLAITLHFLAAGETYKSLMYQYWVSEVPISRSVPEVCQGIIESFMELVACGKGIWREMAVPKLCWSNRWEACSPD